MLLCEKIDLDLTRTLPNNKLFETEQSPKAGALKNILYAFRFHNKNVEYCQVESAESKIPEFKFIVGI
jgi:hypothetical protein